jgi:DNA-binding MarR family transcriptional regulator
MPKATTFEERFGVPRLAMLRNGADYEPLLSPLQYRVARAAAEWPEATWSQIAAQARTTPGAARQSARQAHIRLTKRRPQPAAHRPVRTKLLPIGWEPSPQHVALIKQDLTRIEAEILDAALENPDMRSADLAKHMGRHGSTISSRLPAIRRAVRYCYARYGNTPPIKLPKAHEVAA